MPEGPRSRASRARSGTIKQARTPCGCVSILLYDIAQKRDYTKVEVYAKKKLNKELFCTKEEECSEFMKNLGSAFADIKIFH